MRRSVGRWTRPVLLLALGVLGVTFPGACGGGGGGAERPLLDAVSPVSGPATGGTTMSLNGRGFLRGSVQVTVGGVPATGVVVLNDAALTCTTPPGVPGAATVLVTTSGGAAAMIDVFRYRDLFEGDYFLALFDGVSFGGPAGLSQWGALTANGAGSVTSGVVLTNQNGAVDGPVGLPPVDYTISQANRVTTPGAVPFLDGGIAASGRVLALGLVGEGDPTGFMLLGRIGDTLVTNADLVGRYHVCAFTHDPASGEDGALFGTLTCDGFGRGTGSTTRNNAGGLAGPTASDLTYLVLPDGTLSLSWLGLTLSGGVVGGGEVAIAAGGTAQGSVPFLAVLVREGEDLSAATFQGTYHYVSLVGSAGSAGPRWTLSTGTAQADGAGTLLNGGAVTNAEGVIGSVNPGGRLDYAVAADGALTTVVGPPLMRGGIVSAGDCACWAGGGVPGEAPQIWIWLR